MCAIFSCGPTVVSREKEGTDTPTAGMNGYRITSMAVEPITIQADSYQGTLIGKNLSVLLILAVGDFFWQMVQHKPLLFCGIWHTV